MHAQIQKWTFIIAIAALVASESAGMQSAEMAPTNELADAVASLEGAAETMVARRDYAQASKAYFILATAWNEMDQPGESCTALSRSLDYYRKSVGDESQPVVEMADDRDALNEIRARFGCARGERMVMDARSAR